MAVEIDILAFSPHPDDAELGCGGALLLAADKGLQVAIADLSIGERSSAGNVEIREKERAEATELLGLAERYSLNLPDTEIGFLPEHRLPVIQLIRETRPQVVLVPYWQDRHPDHVSSSKLVRDACFYAGVKAVGFGHAHRPKQIVYYSIHYPFSPTFVIDIASVWQRKWAAISAYHSQFQTSQEVQTSINCPEFLRLLEAKAIWFGSMIGAEYGEPFFTEGPVGLNMIPGLESPSREGGRPVPYRMF